MAIRRRRSTVVSATRRSASCPAGLATRTSGSSSASASPSRTTATDRALRPGLAHHPERPLDVSRDTCAPRPVLAVRRERLLVARRQLGDDPLLDLVERRARGGF